MKPAILLTAALMAWTPQPKVAELSATQEPVSADLPTAFAGASILDLCGEIEDEQRKTCASACAASGRSYSFESAICGLGSTCKCT